MAIIEGAKSRGVAKFSYDFAIQGGTAGVIYLNGDPLPDNCIVWDGCIDVYDPIVGAGATMALTTGQAANDLSTAAAVAGAPWSTASITAIVPVGTIASCIKLTAVRRPQLLVTAAALTAGKLNVFIQYFLSD